MPELLLLGGGVRFYQGGALVGALGEPTFNPLSVHVLNLETGVLSAGVQSPWSSRWVKAGSRLSRVLPISRGGFPSCSPKGIPFQKGEYRVVFKTEDYYHHQSRNSFFPEIPVVFDVTQRTQHYPIPLLSSPYGFSTYRGS